MLCVCRLILLHPTVLCGIFLLLHPTVVCGAACPQTHTAPPLCSVWCCTCVCTLLLLHLTVVCLQTITALPHCTVWYTYSYCVRTFTAPPHCSVWYTYSYCVRRLLLLHLNVMCGMHTLTVSADSYCSTPLLCVVYNHTLTLSADSYCFTLLYCVVYIYCVCRFLLLHLTVMCGAVCPQTHTAPASA